MEATRDVESGAERALDRVGFSTAMSSAASNNSFRGLSNGTPRGPTPGLPKEPEQARPESLQLLALADGPIRKRRSCQPCCWVAAGVLLLGAALAAAAAALGWLRLGLSPEAVGPSSSVEESHGLRVARETAHFRAVGQPKPCCENSTAKCLSCKVGFSVREFCASQGHWHIEGCQEMCCVEQRAACFACQAGQTVAQYCTQPKHSKILGCKDFCCSEMTAECLACRDHVSTEVYCSKPENARVSGCIDPDASQPDTHTRGPTTPPVTTSSGPHCCAEHSAKCRACRSGVSIGEYCIDPAHTKVPGCKGFCGLIEDNYVYPGGNIYDVNNVPSARACCSRCRSNPNCTSWTWGKKPGTSYHGWCYLKNQMEFIRHRDEAFVSGLPGRNMLTFQIKNRHGICLDWAGHLHLQECGDASKESQQWYIDRRAGVIGTKHGLCIDSAEYLSPGGGIHLQPCIANVPSQLWAFDGISGLIRHVRGFCVDAPQFATIDTTVRMWPCDAQSEKQLWSLWNTDVLGWQATLQAMRIEARTTTILTTTATLSTTVSTAKFVITSEVSLFCWSLMLPWGYEHRLLHLQYSKGKGIFACEESAVYSSKAIKIAGNGSKYVQTRVVHHDLHCKIGGKFMTVLNTPVFVHVWNKVLEDGQYKFHAWTVKVDPDTVFFPERLRMIVAKTENPQADDGTFLNNCRFGLHGPLEVISRRSLERYAAGRKACRKPPQEDVYMQACLLKLGAKQVDSFDALAEEHCKSKGWELCHDAHAAFHPFKTVEKYAACLANASKYDESRGFQSVRVLHA